VVVRRIPRAAEEHAYRARVTSPREALRRLEHAAADGQLDALCARHAVAVMGAFGSATRQDGTEPGDLDVAVAFLAGSDRDLVTLWDELSALSGAGDRLDLLDLDAAGPVARSHGLVGVPLYEAEPGMFARRQIAASLERMDTEWLRRIELELLGSR
jgi:predicted nucleotidyltransferase